MDLDELRSAQSRERQASQLQHLRDDFYAEAAEFIRGLRADRRAVAERSEHAFPSDDPDVRRLTNEIETAEEVVESLYERRVGKVVKMASFAAADMNVDDDGLTNEEADLFETLVADIETNRASVLDALAGEGPVGGPEEPSSAGGTTGSGTGDRAPDTGSPGDDEGEETTYRIGDGPATDGPLSTADESDAAPESAPEPTPTPGTNGEPAREAAPPEAGAPAEGREPPSGDEAGDGMDAASAMGGTGADGGRSGEVPGGVPDGETPAAEASTAGPTDGQSPAGSGADASAAGAGVDTGTSPEPTDTGDHQPVPPADGPPGAEQTTPETRSPPDADDATTAARSPSTPATDAADATDGGGAADAPAGDDGGTHGTLVRVTADVGEIFGVDGRSYDLSAGDVAVLPTDNASVLVEDGDAERLQSAVPFSSGANRS